MPVPTRISFGHDLSLFARRWQRKGAFREAMLPGSRLTSNQAKRRISPRLSCYRISYCRLLVLCRASANAGGTTVTALRIVATEPELGGSTFLRTSVQIRIKGKRRSAPSRWRVRAPTEQFSSPARSAESTGVLPRLPSEIRLEIGFSNPAPQPRYVSKKTSSPSMQRQRRRQH